MRGKPLTTEMQKHGEKKSEEARKNATRPWAKIAHSLLIHRRDAKKNQEGSFASLRMASTFFGKYAGNGGRFVVAWAG